MGNSGTPFVELSPESPESFSRFDQCRSLPYSALKELADEVHELELRSAISFESFLDQFWALLNHGAGGAR